MSDHLVLFNRPDGKQDYIFIANGMSPIYSLPPGSVVLWNTITMGPPRFTDDAAFINDGVYEYIYMSDALSILMDQIGMWVIEYGPNSRGQPGTVPFINGYVRNSFNYVPAHKQWMVDNYRGVVEVWAFKFWLYQTSVTIFNDVDAAVKATYATEPLNKVRWEQKEYMSYSGVIFDIASAFITVNDYEIFKMTSGQLWAFFNDQNEDDLT